MNMRSGPLALAAALAVCASAAWGQEERNWRHYEFLKRYHEAKNKQNFADWEGIAIFCSVQETPKTALQEVCENTYTNAALLAATTNIKLRRLQRGLDLGAFATVGDFLILEVTVSATKDDHPSGAHASIRAYTTLNDVAQRWRQVPDPRTKPRSGNIIFWSRDAIAASPNGKSELVQPLSEAIEQDIKQFFSDFQFARQ